MAKAKTTSTPATAAPATAAPAAPKRVKDKWKLGVRARAAGEAVKQFAGKNKAALIASGVGLGAAGGAYALGRHQGKKAAQSES